MKSLSKCLGEPRAGACIPISAMGGNPVLRLFLQGFFALCGVSALAGGGDHSGPILGVEAVVGTLPYYERDEFLVRARTAEDPQPQFAVLLSRSRYWAENGHLEVVVMTNPPSGVEIKDSSLEVTFRGADDAVYYSVVITDLPSSTLAFYPIVPDGFEGLGHLVVRWFHGDQDLGVASEEFVVQRGLEPVPQSGRVLIEVPNPEGVHLDGFPVTVGVPFPRGALVDTENVRLVDSSGVELPLQVVEAARWSKFGSLKWIQCNFTLDLKGLPQEIFLEYGPGVRRQEQGAIPVGQGDGRLTVDAGRIRVDDGLWFDPDGSGSFIKALDAAALAGGFVEHEDGRLFTISADRALTVENVGSERVTLHSEGWLTQVGGDDQFCRYELRVVLFRNSPVVRFFYTWIYTGDSDIDRIANMGWQFPRADGGEPGGAFLTGFTDAGEWLGGDALLQYDHDAFAVTEAGDVVEFPGGRAPGVARIPGRGLEIFFGARDFWQAWPSELEFMDGSFWFHNWPRNGRSREPIDPEHAVLLRFAHQGEVMDLRLPQEYTEDPIDITHCGPAELERMWPRGEPSAINAQGVARTEEFWLYFAPGDGVGDGVARLMEGLNDETLRPVVDPAWVIGSGAFFEAHHQDPETYGRFEDFYEEYVTLRDIDTAENLSIYGMWLHGEVLWNEYLLGNIYRALRKSHGGYGRLSWLPYARSGDPRLLKRLDAAMRRTIDANFRHHVTETVARKAVGNGNVDRRISGFWICGAVPWAAQYSPSVLDMHVQPHSWLSSWYLTGYDRARDMALETYPQLAKEHAPNGRAMRGGRHNETLIKSLIDTYESTFDPWFLTWPHLIAELHRDAWAAGRWEPYTRNWMPGDREFHRFTGSPEHGDYYVDLVRSSTEPLRSATALAYAWHVSGEEEFLRRLSGVVAELEESAVVGGLGSRVDNSSDLPMALGAFEKAGYRPDAVHLRFPLRKQSFETLEDGRNIFQTPTAAVLKEEGQPLELSLRFRPELVPDHKELTIFGPDGELFLSHVIAGSRDPDGSSYVEILEIPATAPSGVYRVECTITSGAVRNTDTRNFLRGLMFPLTPIGTKEVIVVDEDRMGPTGLWNSFYSLTQGFFFYVPGDVESFTVTNIHSARIASIWNPDGELVWEENSRGAMSAMIDVAPEHRGRLWRIRGAGFIMDPRIPPWFAIDRDRWFELATSAGQL